LGKSKDFIIYLILDELALVRTIYLKNNYLLKRSDGSFLPMVVTPPVFEEESPWLGEPTRGHYLTVIGINIIVIEIKS